MADVELFEFSSSPHVRKPRTTRAIMVDVCIALMPALIMGIVFFGWYAALLVTLAVASAVISEFAYLLIMGKKFSQIVRGFDFSSCVTGLLIGLSIGTVYPWYAPVFGSAFAIIVVKMLFGGTGKNLVNPAITGRILIFMSFQAMITGDWLLPSISSVMGRTVTTSPTTLEALMKNVLPSLSNIDLLLGTGLAGCIGETCKIALILGAVYLGVRGVINVLYPIIYIALTGLMTVVIYGFDFAYFLPSILSGGLILGAIFMATDYTTTPNTVKGNVIYFTSLGLLTAILRWATKMEAVSFAILLMNLIVPLIDKFILNKPFGYKKEKKTKEKVHG